MKHLFLSLAACALIAGVSACGPQQPAAEETKPVQNDSNTPLHLLQPDYIIPYGVPTKEDIKADLDRILKFVDKETPWQPGEDGEIPRGAFRLASYEWGVTYAAMLTAGATTGDKDYTDYTYNRHKLLATQAEEYRATGGKPAHKISVTMTPHALDDCGAVCVSMIKDQVAHPELNLRPLIDLYADYIMNKEFRLKDGTLARNRPQLNTVWLDDMFMGVPALAWYGKLTGDRKFYDEAIRQIRLFKEKMWVPEKNLFRHGWVQEMDEHPAFHWGRANGWAILTMCDVLDALPENYPGRAEVLDLYRKHVKGLAALQSSEGFWHQLVDRNDSYLESSATAIYAYCFAHGICEGWLNPLEYGPAALLAWDAMHTVIDEEGKVGGTCVGTGMAFDPAFYYYRPVSPFAAHAYGPAIFAGAEIIRLLDKYHPRMNDSAIQFYYEDYSDKGAIFSISK